MALLDIELPLPRADELPETVRALIREADQRTQAFVARRTGPGFVLSHDIHNAILFLYGYGTDIGGIERAQPAALDHGGSGHADP